MHTDDHDSYRREFLRRLLLASAVVLPGWNIACKAVGDISHIKGSIVGANSKAGHLARNPEKLPTPSRQISINTLIVGGGISGLSAKRWLYQHGRQDVMLLEMDDHFGGNSHYGSNDVSSYPWGAHYLPIPDVRNTELIDFLKSIDVVTSISPEGLPTYNEYHMCHDPEERLFMNGTWQDGIVPAANLPAAEAQQMKAFADMVNGYKTAIGGDGKDAFAIPNRNCSSDAQYRDLDKIPFSQYLKEKGYTSPHLLWYLEYCCKDDYGTDLNNTSAWAGIHYFASRKGKAANSGHTGVLTWPNGNGFLMEHLRSQAGETTLKNNLVTQVVDTKDGVQVTVYDTLKNETYTILAQKVIMATPQYVNKHLLSGLAPEREAALEKFQYATWMIANLTIKSFPQGVGMPLCWDNVIYGTPSVGYVNANHQDLKIRPKRVVTFYLPLSNEAPKEARKLAQTRSYEYWLRQVLNELEFAHPGITPYIEHADIWLWGHGMIAPCPGFVWGPEKALAAQPINNKIFFAHSDLAGISIFEEAFYQGIQAAKDTMKTT